MRIFRTLITALFFSGLQAMTAAEEAAKVTFADDVFPILDSKCLSCHNTDESKGGLDLASFGGTMTGGSGGAVVVADDPKSSRLFTLASHTEEPVMPPKGTRVTEEELGIIAAWISGGLLETKNSKAKKAQKPKVDFNSITSTGKPEGPPAMPEHLILEPALVTTRPNSVPALAHSPWAPILAVAGQKQILLYDSANYDLLGVLPYPEGFPQTLSFSPNGAYLFCGGGRAGKSGNVVAWDIKTGERVIEVGKEFDIVLGADVSPDLKSAIMGGPGRLIKQWDTVAGEQTNSVKKHTDWLLTAAYSPDGVIFATGDRNGGLYVWESATGYEFYTLKGHTLAVTDLDWRMDGNVLASCSEDGSVMLWEMNGGTQIKKFDAHPGGVQGVDIAPDGTIATVGRDKTVKIWKGDGTAIRTIVASDDIVLSVAVSDDSKRVFTGDLNGIIKGWDIATGVELARVDSNPPPIDQQLASSDKAVSELTGQLPQLEEGIKAASAALTAARAELSKVDKDLSAATSARDALKGQVLKFETALKPLSPEIVAQQAAVTAKSAALKVINDALAAATLTLKQQQDASSAKITALAPKENAVQTAVAALAAAKALVANAALTPAQKTQHDTLATALTAALKAREAADLATAARTAEHSTLVAQFEEAKKLSAAAGANLLSTKTAADASTAALAAATDQKEKADAALVAAELKVTAMTTALASAKAEGTARATALANAENAFKPLRDAAAAATEGVKKAQLELAAKTTAAQAAETARNEAKSAADAATALVAASQTKITELKAKLTPAQTEAKAAADALAAKQKVLADTKTALATAQTELKKAEDLIVASTKQKEASAAKVAAVVKQEADSKKSVEMAKAELHNNQFLQKKWQAAAINLTAVRESENLDDMAVKLDDMVVEETEAKKEVEQATIARSAAESTLATARKAVETGTLVLNETSATVLERALKLVASRAVADLRQEVIQGRPDATGSSVAAAPVTDSSPQKAEIGLVAAETLSYKTPAELHSEVTSLKTRLSDLERFLAASYVEATKTRSTILAADQVARETPPVIAERTKVEQEAARELAEAEGERKRQEQALVDQKKRIEELRAKYLATFPKRGN